MRHYKRKQMDFFHKLLRQRAEGSLTGIPSYCTASDIVIEAVLKQAKRYEGTPVLIEATSNQVNQFGGYTGMLPADYRDFVYGIADRIGFDRSLIILGGDHLGPQPFQKLPEATAMEYSKEMVRQYVLAGYTKIHLDTSMRVADDSRDERLSDVIIAHRGVELMKVCEQAYQELLKTRPEAEHPVFIIGSEVPIPGGAQVQEEMEVTRPEDFVSTLKEYKKQFSEAGIENLWQYVIAVVVQPGVEFGDAEVHSYAPQAAAELCSALKSCTGSVSQSGAGDFTQVCAENLMFEGHSTDYQTPASLKEMVRDGVGILKVGPALTFAAREALFALSHMEDEIIGPEQKSSDFIRVLEQVMMESPENWAKYYHGSEKECSLKRAYSYSDRSRYYMGDARVRAAQEKLFENIRSARIPMGLLRQYMPLQYVELREDRLDMDPRALVMDAVRVVCDDYNQAVM